MASSVMKLVLFVATLLFSIAVTSAADNSNSAQVQDIWKHSHSDGPAFKQYLVAAGRYNTLISLLEKTGLEVAVEKLAAFGVTLFAPTDDAFAKVESTLNTLTQEQVKLVLTYHVVGRYIPKHELLQISSIEKTVADLSFFISAKNPGGAVIIQTGVVKALVHALIRNDGSTAVYGLDAVLIPGVLKA